MRNTTRPVQRPDSYQHQTHRAMHCLLFLLPMLLAFHIGSAFWQSDLLAPRDIHRLLRYFGASAPYLPPLALVTLLAVQHFLGRDKTKPRPAVLAGMLGESAVGIVPLIALDYLTGRVLVGLAMLSLSAGASDAPLGQRLVTDMGAAVYEEFIFRMFLIGLVMLVFVDVCGLDKEAVAIGAIILSSAVFSMYHFSGDQLSGAFPWRDFIFRTLAGAYLGVLYVARGLGVAVGVHAFFNMYVSLLGR
ncbi:MAG: CPBP family intramembrane metalloprotease [Planctomycetes bacterium]|jgi:membrane protease YdiL (CAAX protease family)|nr:CPBP family intramembrane metalloprotease [Planctomycetota bacterium]